MGKALKIMVVFILVLSLVTLFLAFKNYQKRDVLVGRNNIAVSAIVKLAGTIESTDPAFEGIMDFRGRDTDEVTARVIDNPTESKFWDDYEKTMMKLEGQGAAMMDVRSRLGTSSAPEAMNGVIAEVQNRAVAQMATLLATRKALVTVREELVDTIRELNAIKKEGRRNLAKVAEFDERLADAEAKRKDAQGVANKAADIQRNLNDQIGEKEQELLAERERYAALEKEKNQLKMQLDAAKEELAKKGSNIGTTTVDLVQDSGPTMSAGVKGIVVAADTQYGFVVVKLSDEAMDELAGPPETRTGKIPETNVMVRRPGFKGPANDFVTSLRLRAIRNDGTNLAVADNLPMWEQAPLAVGDEVFY